MQQVVSLSLKGITNAACGNAAGQRIPNNCSLKGNTKCLELFCICITFEISSTAILEFPFRELLGPDSYPPALRGATIANPFRVQRQQQSGFLIWIGKCKENIEEILRDSTLAVQIIIFIDLIGLLYERWENFFIGKFYYSARTTVLTTFLN